MASNNRSTPNSRPVLKNRAAKNSSTQLIVIGLGLLVVIVLSIALPVAFRSSSSSSQTTTTTPVTPVTNPNLNANAQTTPTDLQFMQAYGVLDKTQESFPDQKTISIPNSVPVMSLSRKNDIYETEENDGLDLERFGDGRDGDHVLTSSSAPMILRRDMFWNNLVIDGAELQANGFRIFVKNQLTMSGSARFSHAGVGPLSASSGGTLAVQSSSTNPKQATLTMTRLLNSLAYNVGAQRGTLQGTLHVPAKQLQEVSYVLNATKVIRTEKPLLGEVTMDTNQNENGGHGGIILVAAKRLVILDTSCVLNVAGSGDRGRGGTIILHTSTSEHDYLGKLQFDISSSSRLDSGRLIIWGAESDPVLEKNDQPKTRACTTQEWNCVYAQMPSKSGIETPIQFSGTIAHSPEETPMFRLAVEPTSTRLVATVSGIVSLNAKLFVPPTAHKTSGTTCLWFRRWKPLESKTLEPQIDNAVSWVQGEDRLGYHQMGPDPIHGQWMAASCTTHVFAGEAIELVMQHHSGGHDQKPSGNITLRAVFIR